MKSFLLSLFAACVVLFAFVSFKPACLGSTSASETRMVVSSSQYRPEAFILQGDSDVVHESRFRKRTMFSRGVKDLFCETYDFESFCAAFAEKPVRVLNARIFAARSPFDARPPSVRILLI